MLINIFCIGVVNFEKNMCIWSTCLRELRENCFTNCLRIASKNLGEGNISQRLNKINSHFFIQYSHKYHCLCCINFVLRDGFVIARLHAWDDQKV